MNRLLNLFRANARKGSFSAEGNVIYLYDMIVSSEVEAEWFGGVSATAVAKAIREMTGDITLRINSPGGDVFGARAIQAAIEQHPGTVTAYIDGLAASSASFIAASCDKVMAANGAFVMIHKAMTVAIGNADDMLATAELLEKVDGEIAATYAGKAGKDAEEFAPLMAAETWFTAEEAIVAGLVDAIAGKSDAKPSAVWDLSAYAGAPAILSPVDTPDAQNEIDRRIRLHAVRARLNG